MHIAYALNGEKPANHLDDCNTLAVYPWASGQDAASAPDLSQEPPKRIRVSGRDDVVRACQQCEVHTLIASDLRLADQAVMQIAGIHTVTAPSPFLPGAPNTADSNPEDAGLPRWMAGTLS